MQAMDKMKTESERPASKQLQQLRQCEDTE
jgi:hypothetical protein